MVDGRYGMSGWKEFHRNRLDILAEVDRVKDLTANRPVKTAHGDAAEAQIRKWLTEFVPKKYAVTSGYIVPNLYHDDGKLYHFDIIVYDFLNSPILWVEGNSDNSDQGKYRAIPAQHVKAVYEVKSTLSVKTITDVIEKLGQLNSFQNQLPSQFSSAAIFIDLPSKDINNKKILPALLSGSKIHHFWGGVVLRCEVDDTATGLINFTISEDELTKLNETDAPLLAPIDDIKIFVQEDGSSAQLGGECRGGAILTWSGQSWLITKMYHKHYSDNKLGVGISWSRSGFSYFAMEILRTLEGLPRESRDKQSFGTVFDKLEHKKADFQPSERTDDSPFINIEIEPIDDSGKFLDVEVSENGVKFSYLLIAENHSKFSVHIGDTHLKSFTELPAGKKAKTTQTALAEKQKQPSKKASSELDEIINGTKPLTFIQRLVYRHELPDGSKKLLCAAKRFSIYKDKVESETLHSYDDFN